MNAQKTQFFPTTRDKRTMLFTALFGGIMIAVTTLIVQQAFNGQQSWLTAAAIVGFVALILGLAFGFSPRGVTVEKDALVINLQWRTYRHALNSFESARPISDILGSIRLFGIGGLFGYSGLFRHTEFGNFTLWANRSTGLIGLELPERLIVVSVDEPDRLLKLLRKRGVGNN